MGPNQDRPGSTAGTPGQYRAAPLKIDAERDRIAADLAYGLRRFREADDALRRDLTDHPVVWDGRPVGY